MLVSDGVTTVGQPIEQATQKAVKAGIPVTTIAYGTASGEVTVQGEIVNVPSDPQAMSAVADATGGSFFTAESSNQLKSVYDDIQARVGFHLAQREILRLFIGLAIVALFLGRARVDGVERPVALGGPRRAATCTRGARPPRE